MLGTVYYKGIAGLTSMQSMAHEFNNLTIVKKYLQLSWRSGCFISSTRRYDKWILFPSESDRTTGDTTIQRLNEQCLEQLYNKETAQESVNYHCDVLEAKIVFGEKLIVSIGSEFIENNGEDTKGQAKMSEAERKQDCETKAFKRLAAEIKKKYPRLPSIKITEKNAEKIAIAGRKRWKIENEGFNRQKNWQGDITHACSLNQQAMKNHYLMLQISDMIKQLYEWFYLKAYEIKKSKKIYLLNC